MHGIFPLHGRGSPAHITSPVLFVFSFYISVLSVAKQFLNFYFSDNPKLLPEQEG
jgi:hypothetical protein